MVLASLVMVEWAHLIVACPPPCPIGLLDEHVKGVDLIAREEADGAAERGVQVVKDLVEVMTAPDGGVLALLLTAQTGAKSGAVHIALPNDLRPPLLHRASVRTLAPCMPASAMTTCFVLRTASGQQG